MAYRNMETARIAKGYTRPELADIIGVKPGTVFAWERGGGAVTRSWAA